MSKDFAAIATQYAQAVVAGQTVACLYVRQACQRHLNDLERVGTAGFPYVFDQDKAGRICRFVELLRHTKGKWARDRERIVLEAWQVFILASCFGWVDSTLRLRRFRDVYIEVPRKNAKSTLTSGVALYMLTADGEPGAEVYAAATTREQAKIVFSDSRRMAMMDSEFCDRFGVEVMQHSLTVEHTGSKYVPLHAEGSNLDGLNVHFAAIDELHAHKRRDVHDVIDSGRGSRDQPMLWRITTAGSDRSGICYEVRTHVTKVLSGTFVDETAFGIIYTLDDGDDAFDPVSWQKANPNYGVSVLEHDMEAAARYARSMAAKRNEFLTKRLNVWVNADSAWMDMAAWERQADRSMRLEDFEGERCIVALDLASKIDVTAKAYAFERDGVLHLFTKFWLPERAVDQERNSQYRGWAHDGHLTVCPGEVTSYDEIEASIRQDVTRFDVLEVGFDPFQATQLSSHLLDEGVPMVEVPRS